MDQGRTSEEGRRSFVKRGLAGVCAFGCVPGLSGPDDRDSLETADRPQDSDAVPRKWIAALAASLAVGDPEEARRLLKACSAAHWEHLAMPAAVERFRGNVPAFQDFLRSEWGWIIEYDTDTGVIEVNENKSDCVCPLVSGERAHEMGVLCYCSEGFAERLFGAVAGGGVRAEVRESILRGGHRCRYRIQLRG